jgi:hypothetical protein
MQHSNTRGGFLEHDSFDHDINNEDFALAVLIFITAQTVTALQRLQGCADSRKLYCALKTKKR